MNDLPLYNLFESIPGSWAIASVLVVLFVLGFLGAPLWLWTLAAASALYIAGASTTAWVVFATFAVLFNVPPVRRLLSNGVMSLMKKLKFLPSISETEKEAIDAGTVWVEGELFSGKPDFNSILEQDYPDLTAEEQAFLNGPVQEVCDLTDDWEVFQKKDLPAHVWEYLKQEKFFGMIIPKEYGGLGFSPSANSAVVAKLASASTVLGISVMVPNSLGPAELLIHYGTEEQKKKFLPSLASGKDLPAFALTEPEAGSDAGAIQSTGTVFRGEDGKLYVRLNWQKRYITLAAISTVLGLAFKLHDPENLLGQGEHPGITCALVPADTPGVELGKRHDPMSIPFWNCPTAGRDVVLLLEDAIIGGADGAGNGWRMLMESLAAGRGISLPASSAGGVKAIARAASAHAVVRKQFGLSIGKFEGIEEPLARIGGFAYLLEAARRFTNGGLDKGAKPAVVTAIAKYNFTELARKAVNDGMDILAGNAISRGPRNVIAHAYINTPVSITVEGANILTRTLMIFGQGAIRCHPYALKEIQALETWNVAAFDKAFWKHVGHVVRNLFRSVGLSLTRGWISRPPVGGKAAKYYRKMSWASASFALLADIAMGTLGGDLKRKEKITGRFADIFSWMYLGSTVLKRFDAEGRRKEDVPFLEWSMEYAFAEMQKAFDGLLKNMSVPGLTWFFRGPVAAWSRINSLSHGPSDKQGHKIARLMQTPGEQRTRLTNGIYVSSKFPTKGLARLENAFQLTFYAEAIFKKLKNAVKSKQLEKGAPLELVAQAVEKGIIGADEADIIRKAEAARVDAIQVDDFTLEEYFRFADRSDSPSVANGGDGSSFELTTIV